MKINRNLSAVIANNRLKTNENMVAKSMERLSAGLSIVHAKDNPAGMAISDKMQTQINGLDRASQNSQDAQSLLNTADGVLNEITSMLQRMRELCVQAANDTNTESDREQLQMEIEELKSEIDRMSKDTEFNTKALFDGSFGNRVFSSRNCSTTLSDGTTKIPKDDMSRIAVSDEVPAGIYKMKAVSGTQAAYKGSAITAFDSIKEEQAGTVSINGYKISIKKGDTYAEVMQKIERGAEKGETTVTIGSELSFTSVAYGETARADIQCDNDNLKNLLGLTGNTIPPDDAKGKDAVITTESTDDGFSSKAIVSTDGNRVKIQQPNGFQIEFLLAEDFDSQTEISLEVTTMGALQTQVGANEDQLVHINVPRIDTEYLYIDQLDCTTVTGADRGIADLDEALAYVNSIRSKLGAYDNRMEHTVFALDQESENMTNAMSRIRDADIAEEMTTYTAGNVLVQAATSVLGQANDQPEMVLQLLQ